MKKFRLTEETKSVHSVGIVHRIEALVDIPRHNVKKGDLGGFLQFEENLSHEGDAWVADEAVVAEERTLIHGDALISDYARVLDKSTVGSDNMVSGTAKLILCQIRGKQNLITDRALLELVKIDGESVTVSGTSRLHRVRISEQSKQVSFSDNSRVVNSELSLDIQGSSIAISGNAKLLECREILGSLITLADDSYVTGDTALNGKSIHLSGTASLYGKILVKDNVRIMDCARINSLYPNYNSIENIELSGDLEFEIHHL